MPELPDIEDYRHALLDRVVGETLTAVRLRGISFLKSYDPPPDALHGRVVDDVRRVGKRLVLVVGQDEPPEDRLFAVLHLMVAGRLRWDDAVGAKIPGKIGHAAFDFSSGTLLVTEAGTKKRAKFHVERGEEALATHDRGGIEPLGLSRAAFREALLAENRTLKRALTDPRIFSGIGNAFSDEILVRARLSPVQLTRKLDEAEVVTLQDAVEETLLEWVARLRAETGDGFPGKVTAFRPDFAVHGRFGEPCPRCEEHATVQRIRYASNETNYCPACQTGGRILADRSLSRLLKDDWPRSIDELDD